MKIAGTKFLVTGGTGFIGAALVRALVRNGARVRSLDNDSRGAARRLADVEQDVELVRGDIRDATAVHKATEGIDCVCHLAYVNGTEFFYSKPDVVLDVAVKGIVNVIDACVAHHVPEFVLASTSEVYQSPPRVPTDERVPLVVPDPLNPRYSYGGGKILAELMAINFGRKHFSRTMIFRPHNVYGPDMGTEHVIPQFALRMKQLCAKERTGRIRFPIQGTGTETRAFIFIDDMIDGLIAMLNGGENLGIYHVGTSDEISMADLAREVARCFGRDIEIVPGELLKGGTLRRCPDTTKLRALGFSPQTKLREGLARTVSWYAEANTTEN